MLSIKKLLLPLLITSTFIAPFCYANHTVNTNISVQEQQIKEKLHHLIKKHNLGDLASFLDKDKDTVFNTFKKFSIVDENIGYHAYKLIHGISKAYQLPPSIAGAYFDTAHFYPEFFLKKGTTYLLYYSGYSAPMYARVMDDSSQPILFVILKGMYDPHDNDVQWGEPHSGAFIGFEPHFYLLSQ